MKIHFIINSLKAGGAQRVMILLANYFSQMNHDVSIITFVEGDKFKADKRVKRIYLNNGKIKNHTLRSILNLIRFYYKRTNRPTVLIPFITRNNFIGIIVGKIYGIKVISSEHINHLSKADLVDRLTRKYLYRFSDALTVLTKYDIDFYKNHRANVVVMPNPSTFEVFEELNRQREKVILAVGDLNRYHHKGFDNLISLISPVLKEHPDWTLKIVGGGSSGLKFLESLVEDYDISQQVIFVGYSSEVQELMRNSEIYIMTSRFEGLPMVLLEAMSQGMACLSYDCITGPSDIITDGFNGILVKDQDKIAMAKQLNILINSSDLRKKLASNAVGSLERFKIETVYKKYLDIFENILNT